MRTEREATTEQRRLRGRRPSPRLLAAAALLAAGLAAGATYTGGGRVDEKPITQVPIEPEGETAFARWFRYEVDPALSFRERPDLAMVAFAVRGDGPYATNEAGVVLPMATGVTVSTTEGAVTHPCVGGARQALREDRGGFLADLRAVAGAEIGVPELISFDGRPATTVFVDPPTTDCWASYPDFHPRNSLSGHVRLDLPSRLILTEVDGRTFVIQIWAATEAGLEEWLSQLSSSTASI